MRSAQQRMWEAMRVHQVFTLADIQIATDLGKETVKAFVRRLKAASYVILRNKNVHHRQGVPGAWVLARDTGPFAPRLLGGGACAYDRNQKRIIGADHVVV